jgi:hypothetical protein
VAINIQMTMIRRRIKRKMQMMIIFFLISKDFNLLTKKKR